MSILPPAGTSVALIRVSDRVALPPGLLTAQRTVVVPHNGSDAIAGDFLAVTTSGGRRLVANAAYSLTRGTDDIYRLLNSWRLIERRTNRRFPAMLHAEVQSVLGRSRQRGRVIDVSSTGASIEVATRPGGRQLDVVIDGAEFSASLPAHLVNAAKCEAGVVLHLEFDELTGVQQAFLRHLLASLSRRSA